MCSSASPFVSLDAPAAVAGSSSVAATAAPASLDADGGCGGCSCWSVFGLLEKRPRCWYEDAAMGGCSSRSRSSR